MDSEEILLLILRIVDMAIGVFSVYQIGGVWWALLVYSLWGRFPWAPIRRRRDDP
jgi:hypothetical protein